MFTCFFHARSHFEPVVPKPFPYVFIPRAPKQTPYQPQIPVWYWDPLLGGWGRGGCRLRPLDPSLKTTWALKVAHLSGLMPSSLLSSWTQKEFQTWEKEQSGQRHSSVQEVEHGGGRVSSSSNLQGGDPLPPGPLGQTSPGHSRWYVRAKCTALWKNTQTREDGSLQSAMSNLAKQELICENYRGTTWH